jgi:hypothetical protein
MRLLKKRIGAWHGGGPHKRQPNTTGSSTVTIKVHGIGSLFLGRSSLVCMPHVFDDRISTLLEGDALHVWCQRWVEVRSAIASYPTAQSSGGRGRCQRQLPRPFAAVRLG